MRKSLKIFLLALIILIMITFSYFFIGQPPQQKEITWGVTFSQKHAQGFGLDWKECYLSLIDDLGVKNLRLIAYWDLIEPEKDDYNFEDLDWQIKEAEKRNLKIILVVGMKTPRWPECHQPDWVQSQIRHSPAGGADRNQELLEYIEKIVNRYKRSEVVSAWQVENEVFFHFGECPEIREDFFKREIDLVKSLDPERKVIITESGTSSFWFKGARLGDIVGISLYRKVWLHKPKIYVSYFSPPVFYWRKAQIIEKFFAKEVICAELQAEPWGPTLLYDLPLEEQKKTMDLEKFRKNLDFARKTGLKEFYLWGAEWWFWLKEKHNQPEIWQEAEKLFKINF